MEKEHKFDAKKCCCSCGAKVESTTYFTEEDKWYGASEGYVCEKSGRVVMEPQQ